MKYIVLSILMTISTFLLAQNWQEEIIRVEEDTVFSVLEIYNDDNKLCEKRYIRTLSSQRNMSKEDMFMQGIKPYEKVDSITNLVYDEKWNLVKSISISNEDSIDVYKQNKFYSEQILIKEKYFNFEGKVNDSYEIDIFIENRTPQNYNLEILTNDSNLEIVSSPNICYNRSNARFQVNIKIPHGLNKSQILVRNSNGQSEKIIIQSVGYDLVEEDFTNDYGKINLVEVSSVNELYIKMKSNEKLLLIENSEGQKKVPVSMLINRISIEQFNFGINDLKLVNLSTNEVRHSRIKLK